MALEKGYWDKRLGELVCFEDYPDVGVIRGEVLLDKRGYVSPSILWLHHQNLKKETKGQP